MEEKPLILYLNDFEKHRENWQKLLIASGYEVVTGADGDDAYRYIHNATEGNVQKPACIVSDFNMPKFMALDFLRHVKTRFPDIPFIFQTAHAGEEVYEQAMREAGADAICDPGDPEATPREIAKLLGKEKSTEGGPASARIKPNDGQRQR